jgi:hypothetical protein
MVEGAPQSRKILFGSGRVDGGSPLPAFAA